MTIHLPGILFLFICTFSWGQETRQYLSDSVTIRVIDETKNYVVDSLGLKIGDDFYEWETDSLTGYIKVHAVNGMYCYVYAWDPLTKKSPLKGAFEYFGTDEKSAKTVEDSLKGKGYETMLYKTAGTSAAKLTSRMLQYNPYSLRYIIIHEAVHRHRAGTGSPLPYVFEEALCDLVAVYGIKKLNGPGKHHYLHTDERLHYWIKKAVDGEISPEQCGRKVKRLLRKGDAFQRDRFGYRVNRAYLERYTSYCKHYFLLQVLLLRMEDQHKFLETVFSLAGTEEEVEKQLKGMVINKR